MKYLILLLLLGGCGAFRDYYDIGMQYKRNGIQLPNDYKLRLKESSIIIRKENNYILDYGFDYSTKVIHIKYTREF